MHTTITTGKCGIAGKLFAASAFVFMSFFAGAEEIVKFFDFENQELGEFPEETFGGGWGSATYGRQIYVTNIHSFKSEKSLAIRLQPKCGMFGLGLAFKSEKNPPRGLLTLEFDFRFEAGGEIGGELRCSEGKLWPWGIGGFLHLKAPRGKHGSLTVGEPIKKHKWYHFKYTMPLTPEDGAAETVSLKDCESGKEWTLSRDHEKLGAFFLGNPKSGITHCLNFNTNHMEESSLIYLDNIKLVHAF